MASTTIGIDIIAKDRASRTLRNVGDAAGNSSHKAALLGAAMKKAALGVGLLVGAAAVFTVKVGAAYVNSLNQIQALTGANNAQMDAAATALEKNSGLYAKMGQTTGDAAAGVVELTKSGLSLHDALKSINATMTLAKAGEMSVADASSVTANALNTFHLKATAAGKVANYLANAANISSADVSDLAESLKYVSPVAASAGLSIKQTSAIMAELANAGIKGSQAGTSLRTFLLNLQAPTSAAAKEMEALGVNIYDASGKMKPMGDVIGILGSKINHLTPERAAVSLKNLFGKTGIAGATTILNEGKKGFDKYTKGVERAGAAAKLAQARSKGLSGSLDIVKSSAISGAQSIYRKFSPIADKVIRPLAQHFADFTQNLGPKLSKGLEKVKGVFDKFHIPGLAKSLATDAKKWAAPIIGGVKTGLKTGDWSGLGKAVGNGIAKAVSGAGAALGKIADAIGKVFAKVDWIGLGITVGKQAVPFVLGFAAGIMNVDLGALLKGMAAHWQEILIGVVMVALTPAKIAAPIARALEKIPFAGKLLAWGFRAINEFGGKMKGAVWDGIKFIGRAFMDGFRKEFPRVGNAFTRALDILPTRLGVLALDVKAKALSMMRGLGTAIGRGTGGVVGKLTQLIRDMLKPFANAGSWLIKRGGDLMAGMARGIASKLKAVLSPMKAMAGRIKSAVGNLGSTLFHAGEAVIEGLWSGISSKLGWLGGKLGGVASFIQSHKGPIDKDRRLLRPAGQAIMDGLMRGIADRRIPLQAALGKVVALVQARAAQLKSLMSAKSSFAQGFQSFTTSVFDTDLSHTVTGPHGHDHTTPATVHDMLAYQKHQRYKARKLRDDVQRLHRLGLSNSLIRQLQASGEAGMQQIHTLASSASQYQINQLNAANAGTTHALRHAGQTAGGQLYDARIKQAQNNEDLAKRIAAHLRQELHDAKKGEHLVITDANGQWIIKAIHKDKRIRTAPATP